MAAVQTTAGGAYALSLAVVVAIIYLAVVRFMDLNEKEPLWAMGLLFFLGFIFAAVLPLLVGSAVLELTVLWGAVAEEAAKFVAFALGAVALAAVARSRGWSEISGLMDGVVYGVAAGLGFAVGQDFIREILSPTGDMMGLAANPVTSVWTTALSGLSHGLFGAIIGAGFGAAAQARSSGQRFGYPALGFAGAILVHTIHQIIARGNAMGGSEAVARTWFALLLPLAVLVGIGLYALGRERRAIREELARETENGVVTAEEVAALQSFGAGQARYGKLLTSGDFGGWAGLRELQNRQVQLALAKRRLAEATDPEHRADVQAEVESLRASVLEMKQTLASMSSTAAKGANAQ